MKLKIAVCGEERAFCEQIQRRILNIRPEDKVHLFQLGNELLTAEKDYDIVFLDIELSDKNGIEVARELRKNKYKGWIVFLTSHIEFMPDAFEVKAFRFFEKTITTKQLYETIYEIEKEMFYNRKMIITDYGVERVINLKDILFVETVNKKTVLHTVFEKIETPKPLKYWKEELGTEFFYQIHKSYVVGLMHVKSMKDGIITLRYVNREIPVSRRNYANFKKEFYTYIEQSGKFM